MDEALRIVLDATPNVLYHNTESCASTCIAQSDRGRAISALCGLLQNAKKFSPGMVTKSGVMVGLGETMTELVDVFRDLAERQVDILTVGQYLRPVRDHLPIARFYTPAGISVLERRSAAARLPSRGIRTAGAIKLPRPRASRRDLQLSRGLRHLNTAFRIRFFLIRRPILTLRYAASNQ